jgi:hypothetical protein
LELFQRLAALRLRSDAADGTTKPRLGSQKTDQHRVPGRGGMQAKAAEYPGNEGIDPLLAARQAEHLHQPSGHTVAGPITGEQSRRCIA